MNQDSLSRGKATARSQIERGRLQDASVLLKKLCAEYKHDAENWHLLATVSGMLGNFEESALCSRRVLDLNPNIHAVYSNLATALLRLEKYSEARTALERAVQLNKNDFQAHNLLGGLFQKSGELEKALVCYREVRSLRPASAAAHYNLGAILQAQGEHDEALACYRKALSLNAGLAEVHNNLGLLFRQQGKDDQAIASYLEALSIQPENAEVHNNLGTLYQDQFRHDQALACYRKALSIRPDYAEARINLAKALQCQGENKQALVGYRELSSIDPENVEAHWAFAIAQIPLFYGMDSDMVVSRAGFSRELAELDSWFDESRVPRGYLAVGSQQPFYLAYQEENNRDLLSRYGTLCARLMNAWMDTHKFLSPTHIADGKVRVGIVSAQIANHSVWNALVKGWFKHLDRGRFELYAFHLGSRQDEETAWARSQSAYFAQGEKVLHQWLEIIAAKQPDVLIYPEIGIDPMTVKLASLRLAPVQVATWGHPETTGLPDMDYYLSAADLEPENAQENYTEHVVSLPHLGCCYHPLPVVLAEPDMEGLGIGLGSPVFICPGTPFKYVPEHDQVFVEIARRVGQCRFVFFMHHFSRLSQRLCRRLEQVFARNGLQAKDYIVFIPWQARDEFYGLMKHADVFLDSIGFSGFNTAMQAMECGLPLVTRKGKFLRGRLASGILRRIGLSELITESEADYVSLAVRLALDAEYNQHVRVHIEENRHKLFEDLAPVRALEEFLLGAVKTKSANGSQ